MVDLSSDAYSVNYFLKDGEVFRLKFGLAGEFEITEMGILSF
jgi:hypothetical protein